MKKRVTILLLSAICVLLLFRLNSISKNDYNKIFNDFYENKLVDFLEDNELDLDINSIKDHYIIDLKNKDIPQLVLIYGDYCPESIVISYKHRKFLLEEPIDLFTSIGSGGSEYKMVLSKDGDTFYYTYKSNRLEYGVNSKWAVKSEVFTYINDEKITVDELVCDNGVDYFLNGEKIPNQLVDNYDLKENYNVIIDSRDYILN